jgi:hypothetical protein
MKSIPRESSPWVVIALTFFIAACGAHPKRVDCEGHLRPINVPAPVTPASGTSP